MNLIAHTLIHDDENSYHIIFEKMLMISYCNAEYNICPIERHVRTTGNGVTIQQYDGAERFDFQSLFSDDIEKLYQQIVIKKITKKKTKKVKNG